MYFILIVKNESSSRWIINKTPGIRFTQYHHIHTLFEEVQLAILTRKLEIRSTLYRQFHLIMILGYSFQRYGYIKIYFIYFNIIYNC